MTTQEPVPEHPRNVDGVHETVPAELGQIEGGRTLGNDARERLRADGFTEPLMRNGDWATPLGSQNSGLTTQK